MDADVFFSSRGWDELLGASAADFIFLSSGWLRAASATYAKLKDFIGVAFVEDGGDWAAAAAFTHSRGILEFLGTGPSDYLDILVKQDLSEADRKTYRHAILAQARKQVRGFRAYNLKNIPRECGGIDDLLASPGFHSTTLRTSPAPTMDASALPAALKKDALRRAEKKLARQGVVTARTMTTAEEILPRLDDFCELHRKRWSCQPTASPFSEKMGCDFYRKAATELSSSGCLRYTEIRVDDRLAAAHFGFVWGGRFIWYKPCFDLELADLSPGVVLLAHLFRRAIEEGVEEFDFTIGDEAFKSRYATREREVVDLYLTDSWLRSQMVVWNRRGRGLARRCWDGLRKWVPGKNKNG